MGSVAAKPHPSQKRPACSYGRNQCNGSLVSLIEILLNGLFNPVQR